MQPLLGRCLRTVVAPPHSSDRSTSKCPSLVPGRKRSPRPGSLSSSRCCGSIRGSVPWHLRPPVRQLCIARRSAQPGASVRQDHAVSGRAFPSTVAMAVAIPIGEEFENSPVAGDTGHGDCGEHHHGERHGAHPTRGNELTVIGPDASNDGLDARSAARRLDLGGSPRPGLPPQPPVLQPAFLHPTFLHPTVDCV